MLIRRENHRYDMQQQQQQQGTNLLDGGVQAMLRRRQVVSPALHAHDDD